MAKERVLSGQWPGFYPGDWVRPRGNPGTWIPFVDVSEVFPGNRSVSRQGVYDVYDAPIGVRLEIEEATKASFVFEEPAEWETESVSAYAIWQEDGHYHMLYRAMASNVSYAVSQDCYLWARPELGEVEYNGSTKNNILANGPQGHVFEDPSAPPEERFKAIGAEGHWYDPDTWEPLGGTGTEVPGDEAIRRWAAMQYEGLDYKSPKVVLRGWPVGWTSPDRLHWKRIEEPLADYSVNGGIAASYEPESGTYFAYMQPQGFPPMEPKGIGTGAQEVEIVRRTNGFSRTTDFRHWPPPKLIMHPDAQDDLDISFYGHNYFPYPGRKDLHGMTIPIFHQATGQMDVQIAFSRDGLIWYRPERKAAIPVGSLGSGEEGMVGTWNGGLVELPDGYWGVPYWGSSVLHNVKEEFEPSLFPQRQPRTMRWARWQPHRFCGMAAAVEGRFTVPTIYRRKNELRLNYRCKPGGWVSVELLRLVPSMMHGDVDPLTGFTFQECDRLTGDSLDALVTWQGNSDISGIGEMVAIRLKMFQATIFAYQV